MFARADFNQYAAGDYAITNAGLLSALRRLPPSAVRSGLLGAAWLETWLRWPLATLKLGDVIDETLDAIDPRGDRFGLTPRVRTRIKRNVLYNQLPDIVAIMNTLDRPQFRRKTLSTRGQEVLEEECANGPGAIVCGFRTGPYPAFPWALAAAAPGREVLMIVGTEHLAELARRLGRTFMSDLSQRVSFVSAQDAGVLARSFGVLKQGGIVATLLELSPVEFARKTPVRFLDWVVEVPFGFSYLSAMTGRPVIPAALASRKAARYRLSFGRPVPAAERSHDSIAQQTQELYTELERRVRRAPEQWVGWLLLESNMGIKLPVLNSRPLPAVS
jgi:lauroyl/myristoyl acyltransferase